MVIFVNCIVASDKTYYEFHYHPGLLHAQTSLRRLRHCQHSNKSHLHSA